MSCNSLCQNAWQNNAENNIDFAPGVVPLYEQMNPWIQGYLGVGIRPQWNYPVVDSNDDGLWDAATITGPVTATIEGGYQRIEVNASTSLAKIDNQTTGLLVVGQKYVVRLYYRGKGSIKYWLFDGVTFQWNDINVLQDEVEWTEDVRTFISDGTGHGNGIEIALSNNSSSPIVGDWSEFAIWLYPVYSHSDPNTGFDLHNVRPFQTWPANLVLPDVGIGHYTAQRELSPIEKEYAYKVVNHSLDLPYYIAPAPDAPVSFDFDLANKHGGLINGTFIETDRMLPAISRAAVGIGANREYPLNFSTVRGYAVVSWNGTTWDLEHTQATLTDRMYGCRLRESDGVVFSTLYNGGYASWDGALTYAGGSFTRTVIGSAGGGSNWQCAEVAEDDIIHFGGIQISAHDYTSPNFTSRGVTSPDGLYVQEMVDYQANDFMSILTGNLIATQRYTPGFPGSYVQVGASLSLGNTFRGGFVYGQYAFISVDFTGFRVYKWSGSAWSLLAVLTTPLTTADRFMGMTGGRYPGSDLIWVVGTAHKASISTQADVHTVLMMFNLGTEAFTYIKDVTNDDLYGAGTGGLNGLQPQRRNENDPYDMGCYTYSRNAGSNGSMFSEFDVIPVF